MSPQNVIPIIIFTLRRASASRSNPLNEQTKDASYQQWSYLPLQYMIRARRLSDRMLLTSMFVPSNMVVKRCFMKCVPWLYGPKPPGQLIWSVTVVDATRMIGTNIRAGIGPVRGPGHGPVRRSSRAGPVGPVGPVGSVWSVRSGAKCANSVRSGPGGAATTCPTRPSRPEY